MFIGKKFANKVMGLRVNQSKITENAKYKFVNLTVAWVAQLRECWSADQEVAGLNPGQTNTQGLKRTEKFCLCNDICKRLDFLVLLDKDEKPQVLSHSTYTFLVLVGCKRTHTTVRKEQGTQTLVVWPTFIHHGLGRYSINGLIVAASGALVC